MVLRIFYRLVPFLSQASTTQDEPKPVESAKITPPAACTEQDTLNDDLENISDAPSAVPIEEDRDDDLRRLLVKIGDLSIGGKTQIDQSEQRSCENPLASPSVAPLRRLKTGNTYQWIGEWGVDLGMPKPFFTLDRGHAEMLLVDRRYFIVYPSIYMFERNRIICRITDQNQYQAVDNVMPNPPPQESYFYLENMPYWFDKYNELWYNLSGQWYTEVVYYDLESARGELARCAVNNQIPTPSSALVASPSANTITSFPSPGLTSPGSDDEYLYPPFSSSPNKEEVDRWFEEFKSRRAALQKTRERVPEIKCPVPGCGKQQRRPQALRDHLYFHFDIKPYPCTYGCLLAFETEANRNRHLDSCAFQPRSQSRY